MSRSRSLARIGLILGLAAAAGCTDADAPLRILQNQAPTSGCSFSQNPGTEFITRGRIDTESSEGYVFLATVKNFATISDNTTESQRIAFVEGADVNHAFPEGLFTPEELTAQNDSGIANFSTRFSGFVNPDGGTATFKFITMPKELIDAIGAKITDQVVPVRMDIQVFGDLGGGSFSSETFVYWVDVCKNCMLVNVGPCADIADGFEALEGGQCNPLQDIQTECCTAADSSLTCPAAPPIPIQQ